VVPPRGLLPVDYIGHDLTLLSGALPSGLLSRPNCTPSPIVTADYRRPGPKVSPARVLGSHFVLDDGRSRNQAARFQGPFQQPSHAYLARGANAGYNRVTTSSQTRLVSMATTLSRPIPNTSRRLTFSKILQRDGIGRGGGDRAHVPDWEGCGSRVYHSRASGVPPLSPSLRPFLDLPRFC
jgi:hypothetical protein